MDLDENTFALSKQLLFHNPSARSISIIPVTLGIPIPILMDLIQRLLSLLPLVEEELQTELADILRQFDVHGMLSPAKVLQVSCRVAIKIFDIAGELAWRCEVSHVDVSRRRNVMVITRPAQYDGDDSCAVHGKEELLRDVLGAETILEGKVKFVRRIGILSTIDGTRA